MKRKGRIIAAVAACAAALGVAGMAGCSSANTRISINSLWYLDTKTEGIQYSSVGEENAEVLLYNLTFDKDSGSNDSFRVEYYTDSENFDEGENAHYFKTSFYATGFDWSAARVDEDYRLTAEDVQNLPEGDKARFEYLGGTSEVVYVLETELKVSGRYILGEGEATADNSVEFADYMNTTTYFRSARNRLEPVYSEQQVHTTSPMSMSPSSKDDMCREIEYTYSVSYNFECTEATYVYTEGEDSQTHTTGGLQNTGYSLFDNNMLYAAIRGMGLSDGFGAVISLLSPADVGIVNVAVSGGTRGELSEENDSDIIGALENAYGEAQAPESDGEESTEDEQQHSYIYYNTVSIGAAGGNGVTRTAWYAELTDADNNTYRSTMLRLIQPLSYGLGRWDIRLAEVQGVLGGSDSAA